MLVVAQTNAKTLPYLSISWIIKRPKNKVKELLKNTEQVKLNFHSIPQSLKILRR